MKMRVVAYARYSSDNQREESIYAQLRAIKDYAKQNNMIIVKTYADRAMSGTKDNRPDFMQMIMDSRKGIFDAVIVHKLNRFSRNKYDAAKYKHKLQRNNVKLLSVLEKLDDSPESGIMESLLVGMAEYESKKLAREVMKGSLENARTCRHNGGLPPLGYRVDSRTQLYIINEETSPIIRLIYDSYINGKGYNYIANELNKKGLKTAKGNKLTVSTVKDILKNEKYIGTYTYNKAEAKNVDGKRNSHKSKIEDQIIKIEGGMPAIIDKKDFEEVKRIMERNKKIHNTYNAKEVYLLSGLIECGECGAKMNGNISYYKSNGEKLRYIMYRCTSKSGESKEHTKSIRRDILEEYIITEMEKVIFSDQAINYLVKELSKFSNSKGKQMQDELRFTKNKLSKIEKDIENILLVVAEGNRHASLMDRLSKLEEEKESLVIQLEETKLSYPETEPITASYLKKIFKEHKDILEQRDKQLIKKFIALYVEKVMVFEDYVDVVFKLSPLLVQRSHAEPYHK
ncbi:recombinase family protein [Clostridium sp. C8]|uniref:recombinase family protein n=1 Tax=Clostridium sp. C8 TaxID=1667357 RepID=UPI00069A5C8D|nr:recombinase family protein [Clostridium sp. C8]